jgi:hypothetical protein
MAAGPDCEFLEQHALRIELPGSPIPATTITGHSSPGTWETGLMGAVLGVGRFLGNGLDRGDGVGLGVGVGVGVGIGVGVAVAEAVEVGVGVGVGVVVGVNVAVAVGAAVTVGVGVFGVAVGVGVVPACTSNEPLSIRPFTTRLNPGPRWSEKRRWSKIRIASINANRRA